MQGADKKDKIHIFKVVKNLLNSSENEFLSIDHSNFWSNLISKWLPILLLAPCIILVRYMNKSPLFKVELKFECASWIKILKVIYWKPILTHYYLTYTRHYKLIFHCGLYCRAVSIANNLCTKQGKPSIFEPKIRGL
jgi:hypothetical protein